MVKPIVPLLHFLENIGRFCHFAGRTLGALPSALARPGELSKQLFNVLIGTFPLAAVAGFTLGIVIWLHLHLILHRFQATEYLPEALALAVVVEFAPTGVGLIVAGRSGASLGAELGSMRQTEQVDALEVLGISPLRQLVAPRVLACMLALPLLTVFVAFLALGGSYLAEAVGGNLTLTQYTSACVRRLHVSDALGALVKTVVFGYVIGVSGCYFGLTADGGTEGVGRAATRGVVLSTLLVLASNVLLVRLTQLVS